MRSMAFAGQISAARAERGAKAARSLSRASKSRQSAGASQNAPSHGFSTGFIAGNCGENATGAGFDPGARAFVTIDRGCAPHASA